MNAPALLVAIPILIGVLFGSACQVSPAIGAAGLFAIWILATVAFWRRWDVAFLAAACAGPLVAGMLLGSEAIRAVDRSSLVAWYSRAPRDAPVRVVGILAADAAPTPSGITLVLDVQQVDGEPVRGGARLSVAGSLAPAAAAAWRAGRSVSLDATLRLPLDYRDPGVPGERDRLARQGIVLVGSVKSAALVSVAGRGTLIDETAAALRARVRAAMAVAVGRWSPASAGVVTAILIGDRSGLDAEDERRLQEAGTYHVIAISGGNIALLTALLVAGGRAMRLPPRATAACSIALLAFYGYAAGLAPSVLRATLAGMIYLAARAMDHRGAALNAIAVAAASAAVGAPLTLLDPGFALSFGATFAIIIGAYRIGSPDTGARADRPRGRLARWTRAAAVAARALGVATLCAEVALAPIGARLFGRVSVAGLVLNFAAIPLMSVIQIVGLMAAAMASVSVLAAAVPGWVAHAATIALLRSAALVDEAPWLVVDLPPPANWLVAAWYAGWAGVLLLHSRPARIATGVVAAIAGAAMIAGPPVARSTRVPDAPKGWTRVVFLDVGQGDATLIQPSDSEPMLVDAGGVPGTTFDLGRRVTLPAVWAFGASRLRALALTHGDPDHIGGAPPILRALRPREIWDGVPVPTHEPLQRLRDGARRAGAQWIERRAGEAITAGIARIRVLNPPDPTWERRRVRNDDSLVLDIRIGDVAFVLTGDITRAVEPAVAQAFEDAPIVIVKVPHHGSAGSSSEFFVDALHPAAAVVSAGKRNPFGHPAPAVVARYRAAGARILSTADEGAIVMDTDGQRVVIRTWAGRDDVISRARPSQGSTPAPSPPASTRVPSAPARGGDPRGR